MGELPSFGGHDFIAHQQGDRIRTVDMLTKEHPKQHGPRERLREKALDGPVTAALPRPAGDAQHGYASRHGQQRHNNTAELTQRCSGHSGLETLQKGSNVHESFLEVLSCRCGRQQLYAPPEALSS